MRERIFLTSTSLAVILFIGVAAATTIIITGLVMADIRVPTQISFGTLKLQQDVTRVLIIADSPLSQSITINSTCVNPGAFSAIVNMPIGSTTPVVQFINNGTTYLNPNITQGNITLAIRGQSQGLINCTLNIDATNQTNVTVVSGGFQ